MTDRGEPQFAAGPAVAVLGDRAGQPGLATVGLVEGRRFGSISVPLYHLEIGHAGFVEGEIEDVKPLEKLDARLFAKP